MTGENQPQSRAPLESFGATATETPTVATPISRRALLLASIASVTAVAFRAAAGLAQTPAPTSLPIETLPPFPVAGFSARAVNEQPRVILFYASWCRLCAETDTFALQYAAAYRNIVAFRKIDIETQEGEAWVLRYQVPFVPTYAVERPDGQLDRLLYSQDELLQDAARIARS
jgi:thiol-disulfide isomerase/thioredoxin